MRDYGAWLMLIAVIWTALAAYRTSRSGGNDDDAPWRLSGILLAVGIGVAGTVIAIAGATPPPSVLTPL